MVPIGGGTPPVNACAWDDPHLTTGEMIYLEGCP
jgi:hypothetical protein